MAEYNEVTLPQWQNVIRRVFGLQGPGGNVPIVAPEIVPVVILQPSHPEFHLLRKEKLWRMGRVNAGGVGTVGSIGIVNPSTSGVMAVFTRILHSGFSSGAGVGMEVFLDTQLNIEAVTPNVGATVGPRDTRLITPGAGVPATVMRHGPTAAGFTGFQLAATSTPAANVLVTHELRDLVLMPGFGFVCRVNLSGSGNITILNAEWYERVLETSEERG